MTAVTLCARRALALLGQAPHRCLMRTAAAIPDFDEMWTNSDGAASMSVDTVAATFNGAFQLQFPDEPTRAAMLEGMRASYCRRLLQECAPAALARLRDPHHLPTHAELCAVFGLGMNMSVSQSTLPPLATSRASARAETDLERLIRIAQKPVELRSLEDNFRLEWGALPLSALAAFCEERSVPELLTEEHVASLGAHIALRRASLNAMKPVSRDQPVLVIAQDATAGRLARILGSSSIGRVEFIGITSITGDTLSQAVAEQEPCIVVCWWMPAGLDLTAAWRAVSTVQEYILVGPADSAEAGLPWETWGFVSPQLPDGFCAAELDVAGDGTLQATRRSLQAGFDATQRGEPPAFECDGFRRHGLAAAQFQVCKHDTDVSCGRSDTISFQRIQGTS